MKYKVGDIVKFILTEQKGMVLSFAPANFITHVGCYNQDGYVVRLDDLREIFARDIELDIWQGK